MELFGLLLLSIPFFYVLGIIQLISWFRKKPPLESSGNRADLLKVLIKELTSASNTAPHRTLSEQIQLYNKELSSQETASSDVLAETKEERPIVDSSPLQEDVSTLWSRWYSNNSINLLLYVGAFFIVASASIFVSFQWESISGITKALMLTFCSLLFFGFGAWFYRLPKITNAGATFLAIGSLLIPIVGTGWYTFVFADAGNTLGTTWLITSIVAILSYAALALYLKNKFYSYLMTLSSISIVLSFINIASLHNTFYILGGIISSYLLLTASLMMKRLSSVSQELFSDPMSTASQLLLPGSLLFGFVVGLQNESLFSMEGTISLALASAYYLLLYLQKQSTLHLVAAQILLLLTALVYGSWLEFSAIRICYSLTILSFALILATHFYKKKVENVQASFVVGVGQLVLIFLYAISADMESSHLILFTALPAIAGVLMTLMSRDLQPLHLTTVFSAMTLYIIHRESALPFFKEETSLAIIFTGLAILLYTIRTTLHEKKAVIVALTPAIYLYIFLGICFSFSETIYLAGILLISSTLSCISAYVFRKADFIYLATAFLTLGLTAYLAKTDIEYEWYPLIFSALSYVLFGASYLIRLELRNALTNSAVVLAIITPVIFGFFGYSDSIEFLQRNTLITAYTGMALVGLYMVLQKTYRLNYFLSVMGLLTYLWQISYLGISEVLVYTLPIGIYFLGLAFVQRRKHTPENSIIFDGLGLLFLLSPSVISVFGDDALKHTVVLFLLGVCLLVFGISYASTLYKRAGIASLIYAVFSQTYEYIYQLPRWVVVGILGFGLIGTALFLLLRRHDERKK